MTDPQVAAQAKREVNEIRRAINACHKLGFRYIKNSVKCLGQMEGRWKFKQNRTEYPPPK